MYRPRECRAGELSNHIDDPSPARLAGGVAIGSEFIGPSGAFLFGGLAIPPKHQIGRAPDVDLGHHSRESYRHRPTKRLPLVEGFGRSPACIEALEGVRSAANVVQQLML